MNNKFALSSIILIIAILLSACGGTTPTETTAAKPEGCLGDTSVMVEDLNCREIRFAVENAYLPFNYISLTSEEPAGWDYDTFDEICRRLNCTPVYVEASWDTMIQSVADGQFDIAGDGITITEERAEIVDFSRGYIKIEQRLLVLKGENRFASLEEFVANPELVLGTQLNTTNYETATEYLPEERISGFEQMPFAVQALISGDVDAVIIDEIVGMGYQVTNADKLEFVGPSISSDELGFAYPKGSDLVAPVYKALQAMEADGTLAALNQKYFGPDFKITYDDIK